MTEFQLALNKIVELNKQIHFVIKEHNGNQSIVRKCEQISYTQLKSIALETQLPFISKYDQINFEERQHWNSFWILSPLIGKKQLREGKSDFLMGITKIENQRPTFCLLLAPKKRELYIGLKDKAYKIKKFHPSLHMDIEEILTDNNQINKPLEGFFFTILKNKSQMNILTEKFLHHFKMHKGGSIQEKVDESPMNLIGIAEGKYDFYAHLKSVYAWDIAPFDALIAASGNRITQKDGILPLEYNSNGFKFPAFIAKNNSDIDSVELK